MSADPHGDQPVLRGGADSATARLAAILVHGRGGSPQDMLALAQEIDVRDVTYLAPEAAGNTWYPYSFLSPIAQNEPGLTSGLRKIDSIIAMLGDAGFAPHRIAIIGFSQGACLSLEFAARHPRRYRALAGLSGGLIGPPGTPRDYSGTFEGTPVFLGCSDVDPHIPVERVHESADVFRRMGAHVDARIYRGMDHTVSQDEVDAISAMLA